jgi:BirA family biotin operon repressor/biotin-[acetyl-CoA-carboxylase] ligase
MQGHSAGNLERLRQGWTPVRIGRRVVWLDEVVSTNSTALDEADRQEADGLAILADYQTAGRGRQGRRWVSPRGASVLCSILVVCPEEPQDTPRRQALTGRLNMVAAVAACEAVALATEIRPAIKWPNDLRVAGRKLGGILIESRPLSHAHRAFVMGFGINCLQHAGHFPPELADQATSLELEASHPIDRVAVVRHLLMRLDARLAAPGWIDTPRLHAEWAALAEPIGQRIRLRQQGHEYAGRTVAVDPLGGLTVQLDNGRQMWFDPMLTSVV